MLFFGFFITHLRVVNIERYSIINYSIDTIIQPV